MSSDSGGRRPGRVNTLVAGPELARREAAAIVAFAARDPKLWRNLALNWVVGVAVVWLVATLTWSGGSAELTASSSFAAVAVSLLLAPAVYGGWRLTTTRRLRAAIGRQCAPGSLLRAEFASDRVTFTINGATYSYPYDLITHVVQVGDVLVVKPRNHLVLAIPMELVSPVDLAFIRRRVVNRPMSEAATG